MRCCTHCILEQNIKPIGIQADILDRLDLMLDGTRSISELQQSIFAMMDHNLSRLGVCISFVQD